MAGRNSQVSRIYAVLDILEGSPQGLSVAEIATRLADRGHHASKRTIYRDLEALNAAGFPLFPEPTEENSKEARWHLENTRKIKQYLVVSSRELVALYFSKEILTPLKDTPFYTDLEQVFLKIEDKLGTRSLEFFKELSHEIRFEPGPRWGLGLDPYTLETVRACCSEKQILEVTYSSVSSGTKKTRRLGPHYLYFAKGSLYLVAEDLEDSVIKTFGIPRMVDAKMLDEPYTGTQLDPDELFKNTFGIFRASEPSEIKILFSARVAPYVKERRWHATQRLVSRGDGTILFSLEVGTSPELVQWILGFGAEATVIAPDGLKREIVEAAIGVLRNYEKAAA